jgi:hypothetical protein
MYAVDVAAYIQKKLKAVTLELSPRYELVLAWVAVTRQVPETFVGTLMTAPVIVQPVALPLDTL